MMSKRCGLVLNGGGRTVDRAALLVDGCGWVAWGVPLSGSVTVVASLWRATSDGIQRPGLTGRRLGLTI